MSYETNMLLTQNGVYNAKLLNAMCRCAIDLASAEGATRKLAGEVARSPQMFCPAFATIVASLGTLTETSTDQEFYDAVSSIWPLMSIPYEG